jgi:Dolichyl-phosphate-mannose-protein mannosyltransferase
MCPLYGSRVAMSALVPFRHIAHEFAGRCRGVVRRHWLFAVVVACATALRAVVQLAYQPALIFPDSERYLQYAQQYITGHWDPDWLRTSGYSLLLIPAVLTHNLAVVAAVQHLLGLATAVLIYAVLVHFGARRGLAVLATIPVLFDPLQLDIEQYVLTDVSATFLLVVALVVLVWKRDAIGKAAPAVAGLLIAAATIIRESDLLVMIPAVLYLVAVIRPRRRLAALVALLLAGFLPPVLGYLGWYQVSYGRFDFGSYDSQFIYGRIAQFADCTGVSLPAYERPLCPRQPPAERDPNFYMWAPQSPQVTLKVPPGMNKGHIIPDFDRRIIEHQPLTYLKVVAGDILYSFSPVRGDGPERYPTWYHQFHTYFPVGNGAVATLRTYTGRGPHVQPALADFLTGYGRDFYVPGPLLAAGLALGLAGMAGFGRARRSGLRAPCLLFTIGVIAAVEPPFIIATFDWRYELPQLSLIPIAAVLGVTALAGRTSARTPAMWPMSTDRLIHAGQPANANQPVSSANHPAHTGLSGRDGQSPNGEWPASTGKAPTQRATPSWPRPTEAVPAVRPGVDDTGERADAHRLPDDQAGPPG